MLSRRYLQLLSMILVGISVVAFTPRLQHPHLRLSCGSIEGTTLSGAQRFTDDSSRTPDLKAGYQANGVPLPLDLKLISDDSAVSSPGIGFDSLDLQVVNETTGKSLVSFSFTSSSAAEKFFNAGQVSLGGVGAGSQSIEIEYSLAYNSGTSAGVGDGFGFTYDLVDPPLGAAIPEPSTWALMLIGFAGLAGLGLRLRQRAPEASAEPF